MNGRKADMSEANERNGIHLTRALKSRHIFM